MNDSAQGTNVFDKNCKEIKVGDRVKAFGMVGEVVVKAGAFGIWLDDYIDWEKFENQIEPVTFCKRDPCFCYHDFFISFWELMWNYDYEDDYCEAVEIIAPSKKKEKKALKKAETHNVEAEIEAYAKQKRKETRRKYYQSHKKQIAEYQRKYYLEHKKQAAERSLKYYHSHHVEINAKRRENDKKKKEVARSESQAV